MQSHKVTLASTLVFTAFLLSAITPHNSSTAATETCHPSDIALDQLQSQVGHTHVSIVGRVMNNCDVEAAVRIKISILDHAGGVLRVSDFWPASTDNIPAHSGFHFQTMVEGVNSFDRFQVTVVEVKRWPE